MALQFGRTTENAVGVFLALNSSDAVEVETARDSQGKAIQTVAYTKTKSLSYQFLLITGGAILSAGNIVTIDAVEFLVLSVETEENKSDYQRGSCTLQRMDDENFVVYN